MTVTNIDLQAESATIPIANRLGMHSPDNSNATLQDTVVLASDQWLGDHNTAIARLHNEIVLDGGRAGLCAPIVDTERSLQPVVDDCWVNSAGHSNIIGYPPVSYNEIIHVPLGGTSDVGHPNILVYESLGFVNNGRASVSVALTLLERATLEDELLDASRVINDLICKFIVSVSISKDDKNLDIAHIRPRTEEGPCRQGRGSLRCWLE
ncbi:hypothetical protein AC579_8870 [Pseudocercospora musae]|uniref:Uncharacterized protein n=1 Tax=Pseudocercospora musae TaxID=113226 RepID=A0A139IHG4_9PEZI|nr:hypothetical protein AC579_8870 [Pseudocercospora musae]